jgi:hypothetical protein
MRGSQGALQFAMNSDAATLSDRLFSLRLHPRSYVKKRAHAGHSPRAEVRTSTIANVCVHLAKLFLVSKNRFPPYVGATAANWPSNENHQIADTRLYTNRNARAGDVFAGGTAGFAGADFCSGMTASRTMKPVARLSTGSRACLRIVSERTSSQMMSVSLAFFAAGVAVAGPGGSCDGRSNRPTNAHKINCAQRYGVAKKLGRKEHVACQSETSGCRDDPIVKPQRDHHLISGRLGIFPLGRTEPPKLARLCC